MQLLQHFKELTVRPKNTQELKGLILQLAIQGKLTANWRKENLDIEAASELLKRIRKEKEQLVKEKKIRKEKPLLKIAKDEIPYKIPEYWTWCRVGESGFTQTGSTPPKKNPENYGSFIPFIGPADISNHLMKYPVEGLSELGISVGRLIPKDSLMMVCIGGSIGKCNINEIDVSCNQQINTVTPIFIPTIYIKTVCQSPFFQRNVLDKSSGSATPIINKGKWEAIPIPLPPLEEQKEIVNVVETLFKEVEQLEQLTVERISLKEDFVTSALNQLTANNANQEWTFLQEHFKNFFNETTNIKKLRETVLQLAVQGKLTSEWRTSHPELVSGSHHASQLLKRIQDEKAQLIKDKKIKKEKALPKITKDEIPYELPEGWVWCRIRELGVSFQNGMSKRGGEGDPTVVLRLADITNKAIDLSNTRLISMTQIEKERYNLLEGDILITRVNGSADIVGNFNPVPKLENVSYCDHFIRLRFHVDHVTSNDYISIIANSSLIRKRIKDMFVSTAGQKTVNQGHISSLLFSLPPLEEQKAIVEKVNALMGLCDSLEQEVQQSQKHSEQLMQSCLREVFEAS